MLRGQTARISLIEFATRNDQAQLQVKVRKIGNTSNSTGTCTSETTHQDSELSGSAARHRGRKVPRYRHSHETNQAVIEVAEKKKHAGLCGVAIEKPPSSSDFLAGISLQVRVTELASPYRAYEQV